MSERIRYALDSSKGAFFAVIFIFFYVCLAGIVDTQIDSSHNFIGWFYFAIAISCALLLVAGIIFCLAILEYKEKDIDGKRNNS